MQIDAQIKPVETKPFEIKPVQVQFPKDVLRVIASGIPDKIKIEWEASPIPLTLRWPDNPLKVTVDLKNIDVARSGNSDPCDCNDSQHHERTPAPLPSPRESSHNTDRGNAKEPIQAAVSTWVTVLLLLEPFLAGIFGGFSIGILESVEKRRKMLEELKRIRVAQNITVDAPNATAGGDEESKRQEKVLLNDLFGSEADERVKQNTEFKIFFRDLAPELSYSVPAILIGIIAAWIVPGLLILFPGGSANVSPSDPFSLLRLWSLCLMAAMVGEPFIRFALKQVPVLSEKSQATSKEKTDK